MKTLVAYASKNGSTKEIANCIAETLGARGDEVDLVEAGMVGSLDGYERVVLGSAVYIAHWMPSAKRLLKGRREDLATREVWLFSSGPVGDDPKLWDEKWTVPKLVRKYGPQVGMKEHKVFAGASKNGGDFRDWDEIESWAHEISRSAHVLVPA